MTPQTGDRPCVTAPVNAPAEGIDQHDSTTADLSHDTRADLAEADR